MSLPRYTDYHLDKVEPNLSKLLVKGDLLLNSEWLNHLITWITRRRITHLCRMVYPPVPDGLPTCVGWFTIVLRGLIIENKLIDVGPHDLIMGFTAQSSG